MKKDADGLYNRRFRDRKKAERVEIGRRKGEKRRRRNAGEKN